MNGLIGTQRWYTGGKKAVFLCCATIFLVFFFCLSAGCATASKESDVPLIEKLQLVWSANHGQGEQIFFSTWQGGSWSIPLQISDGQNFLFKPVSAMGSDGKIWVVWTEREKRGSFLQFAVYREGWTVPLRIDTGMDDNRAVSIVVDKNSTPWITWTAVGEAYTDVYWSRWDGQKWLKPQKAHPDNNVPDINPALILDENGQVVLSFQTYRNGKYATLIKGWNGRQWQLLPPEFLKKKTREQNKVVNELPAMPNFITEPQKATLFVQTREGSVSIPLSRL